MNVMFQDTSQWYGCYYYSNNLCNSSSKTSRRFEVRLVRRVKRRFMNAHFKQVLQITNTPPWKRHYCYSICLRVGHRFNTGDVTVSVVQPWRIFSIFRVLMNSLWRQNANATLFCLELDWIKIAGNNKLEWFSQEFNIL